MIGTIYQAVFRWKQKRARHFRLPVPVVSVGNIALGGRAKTPLVCFIASKLKNEGYSPVVLSRGYGRKNRDPVFITEELVADPMHQKLPMGDVWGDEALEIFLRTRCPVLVGAARARNAEQYLQGVPQSNKTVFVLDDGFQHFDLARNFDLVVIKSEDRTDFVLPWGRLREGVKALERADFVFELGVDLFKESVWPELVAPSDAPLVAITTRAPDRARERELLERELKGRFPSVQLLRLSDHASAARLQSALTGFPSARVLVGVKEAVKLLNWPALQEFFIQGCVEQQFHSGVRQFYKIDLQLKFKSETSFWNQMKSVL